MNWENLSWLLVILSLTGNVFVIKKNILGQWIWAVSNLGWILFNVWLGAYSAAFLFAVYFGMCIWGIIEWSKTKPASTLSNL